MTDSELLMLWNELGLAGATHYMNFVTALFAYLIVVYLVGDKLEAFFAWSLTFLFSCFTFMMGMSSAASFSRAWEVRSILQSRVTDNPDLQSIIGLATGNYLVPIAITVLTLSYLIAISYLVYKRRDA